MLTAGRAAGRHRTGAALAVAVRPATSPSSCRPRPRTTSPRPPRRAREAQPAWAARRFADRAEVLLRFHDRLLDRLDEFADLVQYEAGKARLSAIEEVAARGAQRPLQRLDGRALSPQPQRGPGVFPLITRIDRHYQPKGSGRRHRPLELPADDGDLRRAGRPGRRQRGAAETRPPDPVQRAGGGRAAAPSAACPPACGRWSTAPARPSGRSSSRPVDYVCFTGSTPDRQDRRGRQCAEQLIGCSLELGGKNPLLVLDDADVERGRRGRGAGVLRQRRPAVCGHRAALRGRGGARAVHRGLRRQDPGPAAGQLDRLRATTWAG